MTNRMREFNHKAAETIIAENRFLISEMNEYWLFRQRLQNQSDVLDLHGLHVSEATTFCLEYLHQYFARNNQPLRIITGSGTHSRLGESRLYPAIWNLLKKNGYRIDTSSNVSQGFIIVKNQK